ncbi:AraC family transcriptional regulator [Hymenobacter cellulosivorans]|uniref:AraC family transcriptional regulator n=1 Tax=Hymenobacter cellulosivorans TaxID=2932249 RepID=A0ABY4F647_9BACT|nr:AraC family transcriptional regulator [Hymenobacter cellulosivorans]UOQ52147.1 AraC family transcriptional regulator [Hymenobacter cellulosivorans]
MRRPASASIKTYQPETFLQRFAPGTPEPNILLTDKAEHFFIVRVEQMYRLFTQAIPPCRATAHTCIFLTSGTARMSIGPEAVVIGALEVLIVPAGQVYSFAPGDENTGFLCHFHPDLLLAPGSPAEGAATFDFLQFWGRPVIQLTADTAGFVENLLQRLLLEYTTNTLHYPDILRAYLLAVLHELNRAYQASAPQRPSAALLITNRFKQLLASPGAARQSVSGYAAQLHITPNHLTKAVRTVTGQSPAKWLEQTLVLEAKVLLVQSALPIGDVAAAVGLPDASYFSRLFRKHTGLSPLAFRKGIEKS